ncbi:capsule assembly Wzi family protein [Spirochaetota bacterium]
MKKLSILLLLSLLCFFQSIAHANPLLNVNLEEQVVYDNFEASTISYMTTTGPISCYKSVLFIDSYEKIKLNLPTDEVGYYLKPISSINMSFYYSQEEMYLEGKSGLKLEKGANLLLFENGFISMGKNFVVYYQLKQAYNKGGWDFSYYGFYRVYGKFLFSKFSLESGIDNVNLGPGENGLLLSRNIEPYPLVKLQTEDHINILGKWDFFFLWGWLLDDRTDHSDPMIFAYRVTWKPSKYIEFGITRTKLLGGKGSDTNYNRFYEIFTSSYSDSVKSFDYDARGSYDISVYLPLNKFISIIKIFKIYFQTAGTDILLPFMDEDKRAFQFGIFTSLKRNIIRLEYVDIAKQFYTQYNYSVEGYSHKGFVLGHPYGSDTKSLQLKHRFYFFDFLSAQYSIGGYFLPVSDKSNRMERYFFSVLADYRIWSLIVNCYFRIDWTTKYDSDSSPIAYSIVSEDKSMFSMGFSLSWRF